MSIGFGGGSFGFAPSAPPGGTTSAVRSGFGGTAVSMSGFGTPPVVSPAPSTGFRFGNQNGHIFDVQSHPSRSIDYATLEKAARSTILQTWIAKLDRRLVGPDAGRSPIQIYIRDVFTFGPTRVGFMTWDCGGTLFQLNEKTKAYEKLPDFVFGRDPAVGILVIVTCTDNNQKYLLLVNQARVPGAGYYLEAPAGIINPDGRFVNTVLEELAEECALRHITKEQLVSLGSMYPSIGGCTEEIRLYSVELNMSGVEIASFQDLQTGVSAERELIKVRVIPLLDVYMNPLSYTDAKLSTALFRYDVLRKQREALGQTFLGYRP